MAGELMHAIRGSMTGLEDELSGATRRVRSSSRVGGPRPMAPTPQPGASTLSVDTAAARPRIDDPTPKQDEEPEPESAIDDELDISPETLQDLGRLGEGASGEVRRVLHRPSGIVMAQKVSSSDSV